MDDNTEGESERQQTALDVLGTAVASAQNMADDLDYPYTRRVMREQLDECARLFGELYRLLNQREARETATKRTGERR